MKEETYTEAVMRLAAKHESDCKKHGAIDMIAGQNFVGYVGKDDEGPFCWSYSWGVDHGKIRGETIEAAQDEAYKIFDAA